MHRLWPQGLTPGLNWLFFILLTPSEVSFFCSITFLLKPRRVANKAYPFHVLAVFSFFISIGKGRNQARMVFSWAEGSVCYWLLDPIQKEFQQIINRAPWIHNLSNNSSPYFFGWAWPTISRKYHRASHLVGELCSEMFKKNKVISMWVEPIYHISITSLSWLEVLTTLSPPFPPLLPVGLPLWLCPRKGI